MKLSRNWLSKYVDLSKVSDKEIFERLTMTTAEFEEYEEIRKHFQQVYIGKVTEVNPHPNADKLQVTKVSIADKEYQIVCGAKNVAANQTVAVALEGTTLPGDLTIKNATIRGSDSFGMICSKSELGLEEESEGIWELPDNLKPGQNLAEAMKFTGDTVFEIDNKSITHRPDLWNHLGFARELAAIFGSELQLPQLPELKEDKNPQISIEIENGNDCPRYCGLIIENIKIEESPQWMKDSLEAVGVRSINTIVDVTNYVMLEMGEPLHAFDLEKLQGDKIFIRRAKTGEKIVTLDSQERSLTEDDLVIADQSGPIALAGVMGGESTEVRDDTTKLFLEAANFQPARIRKCANRVNLRTDAALRFEKSLDPAIAAPALARVFQIIQELNPEATARNFVDNFPKPVKEINIEVSHDFLEKRLGINLSSDKVLKILNDLSLKTTEKNGEYSVTIPSYRATKDLSIAEDIVEEIGRVTGYDNIPPMAPQIPVLPTPHHAFRKFEHQLREIASSACHADEVYLYSFYGPKLIQQMNMNGKEELKLQNFLSDEMDRLRIDLMPGLVKAAADNLRYQEKFRLFEIGRIYKHNMDKTKENGAYPLALEENHLALISVEPAEIDAPFFQGSQLAVTLTGALGLDCRIERMPDENLRPYLHPGRSAQILVNGKVIGFVGELHPAVMKNFDLRRRMLLLDLHLNPLFDIYSNSSPKFIEPSRYPEAFFELSVLAPEREEVQNILDVIQGAGMKYLEKVELLKIFASDNIPEGKKSVSLGMTFRKENGTIPSEELKKLQDECIQVLAQKGFELRS